MKSATIPTPYDVSYGSNPAENYEKYFVPVIAGPFGRDLVRAAALVPGERVLDVACGTGIIARLAAEAVAPEGTVAGVDVNAAMLDVARYTSSPVPIKWYESAAESIPLPDRSFDVVFCQCGLQFVAAKAGALREMHRVLRPGGRVFISTPIPSDFFNVLDREIGRHVSQEAAMFVRAVFSMHEPAQMRDLLAAAEFEGVDVHAHRKQLQLPSPRDFMWQYIYCTPLMALLPHSGNEQTAALERAVVAGWQPWVTGEGMRCEQSVLVASARRAA